jgi:hypothetical protein
MTFKENKFDEVEDDELDKKSPIQNYEYLAVVGLSIIGFLSNLASIIANYWICDDKSQMHYGVWDSCITKDDSITNLTITQCAIQTINEIYFIHAEQQLVEELNLGKSLLVISLCFHFIAIFLLLFIFFYSKFNIERKKNLIYLIRNILVLSLILTVTAILIQIIGFFLFIYGEKLSTGCFILFIYFLLAIFVTNTINFFTIKYKSIYYDLLYLPPVVPISEENMKY